MESVATIDMSNLYWASSTSYGRVLSSRLLLSCSTGSTVTAPVPCCSWSCLSAFSFFFLYSDHPTIAPGTPITTAKTPNTIPILSPVLNPSLSCDEPLSFDMVLVLGDGVDWEIVTIRLYLRDSLGYRSWFWGGGCMTWRRRSRCYNKGLRAWRRRSRAHERLGYIVSALTI